MAIQTASQPSFCESFFTGSLPHAPRKDFFDRVASRTNTLEGSWDYFRVLEQPFTYLSEFSTYLGEAGRALAAKAAEVFNTAGIALSLPKLIVDGNAFRHEVIALFTSFNIPY